MINQKKDLYSKFKINTKIIGKKIYHFKTIDSTNLYAKKLIKDNIEEGTVIISDIQKKGRGRKKRLWSSPVGGLWFSIILYPKISSDRSMFIIMACSISIADAIVKITGLKPRVKWPNDILIKEKKICGILTEIETINSKINFSIVGIGLNVNNEIDENLKKTATSLYLETESELSNIKIFETILKNIDENYQYLINKNYDYLKRKWLSHSDIINKKVKIKNEENSIIGKVIDVDQCGCIILETDKGKKIINYGDLKFL